MNPGNHLVEVIHQLIELAALGIEVLAVAVIIAGVVIVALTRGTVRYLFRLKEHGAYESYKQQLGKPLLLGLELLVAADVIRTVALETTLANVTVARPVGARAHLVELVVGRRDGRTLAVARQSRNAELTTAPGKERMTTHEFFARVWEMLNGRADGPFTLRLILQPTVATIFAIRAGLRDTRDGQPPYFFWSVFTNPARCPELLAQVWKDVC
jgi:uncharacterized membrane protein